MSRELLSAETIDLDRHATLDADAEPWPGFGYLSVALIADKADANVRMSDLPVADSV